MLRDISNYKHTKRQFKAMIKSTIAMQFSLLAIYFNNKNSYLGWESPH